jgi:hypothetical protein
MARATIVWRLSLVMEAARQTGHRRRVIRCRNALRRLGAVA